MTSRVFELIPQDVLFFRDARPMEASDAGLGANWPRPDQIYNAFHNNLLSNWREMQKWEGELHTQNERDKEGSSYRFGALKILGPFPKKGDSLYFKRPLDWGMRLVRDGGQTNLPKPLEYSFLAGNKGKETLPEWISKAAFEKYLDGSEPQSLEDAALYGSDRNVSVAIDPETRASAEGRLFQAEYLRLKEDVSVCFEAECAIKPKYGNGLVDVLGREDFPKKMAVGGQRGVCSIAGKPGVISLPKAKPEARSRFVRWTLLTPALFLKGWLPGWVEEETGAVMLKKDVPPRRPGERREVWKERQKAASPIEARLVAARIGKPSAFSGWDLAGNCPKRTLLAVPAGSCYVFKCRDEGEAESLSQALNAPKRRSDIFGEKGFGIGATSFYRVNG